MRMSWVEKNEKLINGVGVGGGGLLGTQEY